MLRALWLYRGFVVGSIRREFQSRYRNSLLGAAWNVIHPLAMIVVYTVIFSSVMRARLPGDTSHFGYAIHLCAGIFVWSLFSEVVSRLQAVFIENAALIKKLSFPRQCLPAIILGSALLNFLIIFGLFTVFLLAASSFPGIAYLAVVPVLVVVVALALGIGLVLGVLNVFFRDVGHFVGVALQFWFWLTPIVYPSQVLPELIRSWLWLNPMAAPVQAMQTTLLRGEWPAWGTLALPLAIAASGCLLGWAMFRRHAGAIVDEL